MCSAQAVVDVALQCVSSHFHLWNRVDAGYHLAQQCRELSNRQVVVARRLLDFVCVSRQRSFLRMLERGRWLQFALFEVDVETQALQQANCCRRVRQARFVCWCYQDHVV
mmetsp:Transcript_5563/g.9325  ORF Transcript_5563/g.9325 Transcript_5563/m.9325 type:complete len:110 (-) Transcript_5563:1138-1467(-)